MAIDLSSLIQGLGAVAQGTQAGAAQSFQAQQQMAEQERQRRQLESLLTLQGLQAQGAQRALQPAPEGLVGAFAGQRELQPEVLGDPTLGELGQMSRMFPIPEAVDPLEEQLKRAQIEAARARARQARRPQGGLDVSTFAQRRGQALQRLGMARRGFDAFGNIMNPKQKQIAIEEAMREVAEVERAGIQAGIEVESALIGSIAEMERELLQTTDAGRRRQLVRLINDLRRRLGMPRRAATPEPEPGGDDILPPVRRSPADTR